MTEKEYRELPNTEYFHYSFIKAFDDQGPQSLINPKEYENSGIDFGAVVHIMALQNDLFDDIYYVSKTNNELTATEKKLYDSIVESYGKKLDKKLVNSEEFLNECIEEMKRLNLWKNIKDEDKLSEKINDNFKNHLIEYPIAEDKKIISATTFLNARNTYEYLKNHDFTSQYFSSTDIKKKQVLFEIPIIYKIKEDNYKSLLDIIVIDHETKTVRAIDLKTGAKPNKYFPYEFLTRRYDIQAFLYQKALDEYVIEQDLKDYRILDPLYIYTCVSSPNKPLPFVITKKVIHAGYSGFSTENGRKYRGVSDLVSDIKWHRENEKYDYSVKEYEDHKSFLDVEALSIYSSTVSTDDNIFTNYGRYNNRDFGGEIAGYADAYERAITSLRSRLENDPSMSPNVRSTAESLINESGFQRVSYGDNTRTGIDYFEAPMPSSPGTNESESDEEDEEDVTEDVTEDPNQSIEW